jgi:RNA polymerase sigma-70 factor (ECF subfamily)
MAVDAVANRWLPWTGAASSEDWEALYVEQLPRVYNFFRYRVGPAEAEDLAATTFEKAWGARHRYRRDLAGFSAWLFTIARHVAIDHYRARREHQPLDAAAGVPARGRSPEEQAALGADLDRLSRLLGTLADREREIVALKYGAGLTNRQVARAMGLTESNVGTILHRTIQTLRAQWNDQG